MDPPLVLTQHHDPSVIFGAQFSFNQPESSQSPTILCASDDLWSKYYRMSNSYRELYTQNRELSEGHQALKEEYNTLRDTYLRLRCKHQELVDDAMHSRIESWRHAVRLEEVKSELCLLKQNEALPQSSKRKLSDTDEDRSGVSDWSASSASQSFAFSNDTFNTPMSGSSSKFPIVVPIVQPIPNMDFISSRPHPLAIYGETSAEIQTPKRRRYHGSSRPSQGQDQRQVAARVKGDKQVLMQDASSVTPITTPLQCQEGSVPLLQKLGQKWAANVRRSPPQTRSRTRMSGSRRPSLNEQNATAAAVAAALTGNPSNHDPSS